MLEKALAKKSPKVKQAQKKVQKAEKAILAGKSVRGKKLREFKEGNSLLGRWNLLIAKAEVSIALGALGASTMVKNKKLKVILTSFGVAAMADAGGNVLQNRGREFLGGVIEEEKVVSKKSLKKLIKKKTS